MASGIPPSNPSLRRLLRGEIVLGEEDERNHRLLPDDSPWISFERRRVSPVDKTNPLYPTGKPFSFVPIRRNLSEKEAEFFWELDFIYWELEKAQNSADIRQLLSDHLTLRDRNKLYAVMKMICMADNMWKEMNEDHEFAEHFFENWGKPLDKKRAALTLFAQKENLTADSGSFTQFVETQLSPQIQANATLKIKQSFLKFFRRSDGSEGGK